jgi:hypothetical protein
MPLEALEYSDYIAALRREQPELAEELACFQGMGAVLDWMQRRGLTRTTVDIVGMDEFHYDFLLRLPSESWLVFGVT